MNIFVMLDKIHGCIKFLITFGADNFYRFDWGTGMFGFKGQKMSEGIFVSSIFPKSNKKKSLISALTSKKWSNQINEVALLS